MTFKPRKKLAQDAHLKRPYFLSKSKGELIRFIKFCIVGASGVLVSTGSLWFITEIVGLHYLISAVFSAFLSILSNFIFNEVWTFRDRVRSRHLKEVWERFIKFGVSRTGGVILKTALLALFTEIFHIYYLVSNLLAIGISTFLTYLTSAGWVWA